ncbi:hypothetical protein EHR_02805 [Enterococcus hirae ATCC 9790]|uniref:Uncharacterized protein n=1 Tax=Enterococcus hirae (strain ATCC 9790 / DSM 20160 / JCM 8729 / LMG 6399 / NBRC 3181 / NCIMB 6459 / NCDO 1258 / NCTC 12367 / WDCM 00089 / R) TaxID=768486 RepID=I6SVV9_ENTHA|nr:hypothetical protein EHR_02805 [Enterococcus hirae ATCC 9790]
MLSLVLEDVVLLVELSFTGVVEDVVVLFFSTEETVVF